MDYLLCRITLQGENHQFVWILWYIWKGRNNMVFNNINTDPIETLQLAVTETTIWFGAHAQVISLVVQLSKLEDEDLPQRLGH